MPGTTRRASISVLGGLAVCAAVGLVFFLSGGCALSATEQIGGARAQPASAIEAASSPASDHTSNLEWPGEYAGSGDVWTSLSGDRLAWKREMEAGKWPEDRAIHLSIKPGRSDSPMIRLMQELDAGGARVERFTIPLDMNHPTGKKDGTVRVHARRGRPHRQHTYALSRDRDEITGQVEVFRGRGRHGPFSPYTECIFRVRKN